MGLFEAIVKTLDQSDQFHPKPDEEESLFGWLRLIWRYHFERNPARKLHLKEKLELARQARREDRRTWHWNKMLYRHGKVVSRPQDQVWIELARQARREHRRTLHWNKMLYRHGKVVSRPQDDIRQDTLHERMQMGTQWLDREIGKRPSLESEPYSRIVSQRVDEVERRCSGCTLKDAKSKMALREEEVERRCSGCTLEFAESKMALVRRLDDIQRRAEKSEVELARQLEERKVRNNLIQTQGRVSHDYQHLSDKAEKKSNMMSELVERIGETSRTRQQIVGDFMEQARRDVRLKEFKYKYVAPEY